MNETFDIPVFYKGEERNYSSRLLLYGYTHKIAVEVEGREVLFEPDEERNYRALLEPEQLEKGQKMDVELLKSIAAAIESIVK